MTYIKTPVKAEMSYLSPNVNNNGVEIHKVAAIHLEEAAKHHYDAARHIEKGNYEKALDSTVKANEQQVLANVAHREVSKHHGLKI